MQKRLDPENLGIILLNAFMDEFFPLERRSTPDTFELLHYNGIPGSNDNNKVNEHSTCLRFCSAAKHILNGESVRLRLTGYLLLVSKFKFKTEFITFCIDFSLRLQALFFIYYAFNIKVNIFWITNVVHEIYVYRFSI